MAYTQREIEMLKEAYMFEKIEVVKYSRYQKECSNQEVKNIFKHMIAAEKDHLNLINTLLNHTSK
ncbi:MAG: hypothetical protein D5R97_06145 [Candidatus Syntrophonatronum acetioxidans]|uniref:Rubrerythrin diiron-binding domain-containing protein n=1 Tax=Candidatus Syntrophonatronum acetioxidans TaxID=1795816 RepID=A0A424YDV4_9FIRM|nr:MAG: hypothetical protein D5R97_06145 [Candidatus Syntrophonatronum acetioxidans]